MKKVALLAIVAMSLGMLYSAACVQAGESPQTSKEKDAAIEQQARSVKGQVLTSTEKPALRLQFDEQFKYAGSQSFILYDVARAEQHFFVDADEQGRIRRLYWIQFEGYLPSNQHTYQYKINKLANIGGLDFIADTYVRNLKANPGSTESDGYRARAFLQSEGYRWAGDEILNQRLVHMVDETKRSELMIIYSEDLSGQGLTAADFTSDGKTADRSAELSKALLERAVKSLKILR